LNLLYFKYSANRTRRLLGAKPTRTTITTTPMTTRTGTDWHTVKHGLHARNSTHTCHVKWLVWQRTLVVDTSRGKPETISHFH